jgi:peptidoglycan/LPS O-acetylase OafA/YrhL
LLAYSDFIRLPKSKISSVGTGSANLDFLRSVAVLLVIVQHLCRRMQVERIGWIPTTSLGRFGVLLFFVHTSLVLMQSMERSGMTGWPLWRNFYIRRFFRIYPLSILTVLIALALGLDSNINGIAGLSKGSPPGTVSIVSQLLLVQNLTQVKSIVNVLWSLPYEVQMYLVLPFLFVWIRGKRMFWPLTTVWLGSLITATIQPHVHLLSRLSILLFVPNFLAGLIAFTLPPLARMRAFLWPAFVLGLVLAFTLRPVLQTGWVLCLILGMLIPSFAELTTPWLRAASQQIATYSYGIYLSHQFSIWVALGVLASHSLWLRIPVLAGLLVLLPVMLYHWVEKPMIQLGIRLASNPTHDRIMRTKAAVAT